MGQEESKTVVDEKTPPQTLSSRSVDAVAKYILEGRAKKIVVMTGAGISTSAGIPDFRSPDTGLYANLARLNLPFAEAVFDISYFRNNPLPFYTLAQELYPGKYHPTITHAFISLLDKKGLLLKLFTQNIDCLEREAGVPDSKIVEAHGSFARQSCIECKTAYPEDLMRTAIAEKSVPHCVSETCDGLVKPEIVFFGEALPAAFFDNKHLPAEADLCIVMGTSLSVQPFASLPSFCRYETPRVLINQEQVGDLGCQRDDVMILGDCDTGVRKLAAALGWGEELEEMWKEMTPTKVEEAKKPKKTREEEIADEVDKITQEVEEGLRLKDAQFKWLENHVGTKLARMKLDDDDEHKGEDEPQFNVDMEDATAPEPEHITEAKNEATMRPVGSELTESKSNLAHVFPFLSSSNSEETQK